MPRVSSVSDINDAEHKEIITCFRGELVKVGKQFPVGDGTKQPLTVRDKDGDEIEVHVWDHEDAVPRNDEGEQYSFLASTGQRGPQGVMAFDDTYKGKTTRILKVTKAGEVVAGGAMAPGHDDDRNDRREREREREPEPRREREREREPEQRDRHSRQEDPPDDTDTVDRRLTQLANLQCACLDMTARYTRAWQKASKIDIGEPLFQALNSSLFIAAQRLELDKLMPDTELTYESEPDPAK